MTLVASAAEEAPTMADALHNWGEIIRTQNLSSQRSMDGVSHWLLITRASVFPMTLTSAAIGGLLAVAGTLKKATAQAN